MFKNAAQGMPPSFAKVTFHTSLVAIPIVTVLDNRRQLVGVNNRMKTRRAADYVVTTGKQKQLDIVRCIPSPGYFPVSCMRMQSAISSPYTFALSSSQMHRIVDCDFIGLGNIPASEILQQLAYF